MVAPGQSGCGPDKQNRSHDAIEIGYDGFRYLPEVRLLNKRVFRERRIINRFDHDPLLFLTAHCNGQLAGFKIGYAVSRSIFYSAKSATDPQFRKRGVAMRLLEAMVEEITRMGFRELRFDAFPAHHPGMLVIGLRYGFRIRRLIWDDKMSDFRIQLSMNLSE